LRLTTQHSKQSDANVVILNRQRESAIGEICPDGAKAALVASGPIKLLLGRSGSGGFGLLHIEEDDRLRAVQGRGFSNAEDYVFHVSAKWTHLHKGDGPRITIATQCAGGFNALVLHWQDNKFWSVVTALPFRRPKEPLVFGKERSDESEPRPALAARPRFETLTLPKPKGS